MRTNDEETLVTGAAGFIGFHVVKLLLKRGEGVVGLDNFNDGSGAALKEARADVLASRSGFTLYRADIRDSGILEKIFRSHRIGRVCHLAAKVGVRASLADPCAYAEVNVGGTVNLLENCVRHGVGVLVYASSSSVYGGTSKIPFSENDPVEFPLSPYAATKRSCELFARAYHHIHGIKCAGLRYFTVYGPYGRPDMAYYTFTKKILAGEPIEIYNFGKMKRDFTCVDDVALATVNMLFATFDFEILNIGNNKPTEIEYFVKLIEKETGKTARKSYLPMQAGDPPVTFADISKAKALIGFEPKTPIEEGIRNFVQ